MDNKKSLRGLELISVYCPNTGRTRTGKAGKLHQAQMIMGWEKVTSTTVRICQIIHIKIT
jgi:hypothetical protein